MKFEAAPFNYESVFKTQMTQVYHYHWYTKFYRPFLTKLAFFGGKLWKIETVLSFFVVEQFWKEK